MSKCQIEMYIKYAYNTVHSVSILYKYSLVKYLVFIDTNAFDTSFGVN